MRKSPVSMGKEPNDDAERSIIKRIMRDSNVGASDPLGRQFFRDLRDPSMATSDIRERILSGDYFKPTA